MLLYHRQIMSTYLKLPLALRGEGLFFFTPTIAWCFFTPSYYIYVQCCFWKEKKGETNVKKEKWIIRKPWQCALINLNGWSILLLKELMVKILVKMSWKMNALANPPVVLKCTQFKHSWNFFLPCCTVRKPSTWKIIVSLMGRSAV